jgi:O-methyltransferase domain
MNSMAFSGTTEILTWMLAGRVADAVAALSQTGCLEAMREWKTVEDLAEAQRVDPAGLETLLHLLGKAGFIDRQGNRYILSAQTLAALDFITIELRLRQSFAANGGLVAGLSGRSYDPLDTLDDPEFMTAYAATMRVNARPLALAIRRALGSLDGAHILDLGGADGALVNELIGPSLNAQATVVDRPVMRAPFERLHPPGKTSTLARFVAADIKVPESYSELIAKSTIVVLSNIAHLVGLACFAQIMREIRAAAPAGCQVVIFDMFVTQDGPIGFADLAAVDWVAGGHGFARTIAEIAEMVTASGFSVRCMPQLPLLPGGMLIASAR